MDTDSKKLVVIFVTFCLSLFYALGFITGNKIVGNLTAWQIDWSGVLFFSSCSYGVVFLMLRERTVQGTGTRIIISGMKRPCIIAFGVTLIAWAGVITNLIFGVDWHNLMIVLPFIFVATLVGGGYCIYRGIEEGPICGWDTLN